LRVREGLEIETIPIRWLTIASGNWTIPKICQLSAGETEKSCWRQHGRDCMNKDEFKKFYREHLAVPVAGFGMAAVLLVIYLTLMTWIAGHVHLMQSSIDRFGH
jgi:hypothetical protein